MSREAIGSIVGTAIGREWKTLRPGEQSSRYFGLIRPDPELPCPCITSIGGGRGVAGVTHPSEPRKFTIPELRSICGFPADFELVGTFEQQWARLGNAVPPLMMYLVARHLRDGLFTRIGRTRAGFTDAVRHESSSTMDKPPFRIPSMAEVAQARGTTGLTVVSTFSGCGGSCLGFEMAGYRVLWANEFLPIARESYAANHPETILDGRDIRRVEASHILDAIGMKPGELDVFNGSPPCQAFSSAGQGAKGWGKNRDYGNGVSQKNENLFFEYIRLLKGLQPRAFVAENVAGLTRGVALGYFKNIMRGLAGCGYTVRCKVLDAQWMGVPQSRSRAIFIGVRNDLGLEPEFPKPLPYRYSLRDVLPGLSGLGHRGVGGWDKRDPYLMRRSSVEAPAMTITSKGSGDYTVIDRVIHDTGGQPEYSSGDITDSPAPTVLLSPGHFKVIDRVVHDTAGNPSFSDGDVTDKPCPAILASRSQSYQVHERVVDVEERAEWLTPGSAVERDWKTLRPGEKSAKYFNVERCDADSPSPAIMAAGGAGPASTTSALMPNEARRFSIGELRIICGFPADFELKGTYAERWARLGNAVPPLMMREIAGVLRDGVFAALGRTQAGFIEAR